MFLPSMFPTSISLTSVPSWFGRSSPAPVSGVSELPLRLSEYSGILGYTFRAVRLSRRILGASLLAATAASDSEKLSSYECGFNPFDDARSRFDIRFYLVAIRFIVFDIEASFLYPWAMTLGEQGAWGFFAMMDFLFELVIGYLYAWKMGALEWE